MFDFNKDEVLGSVNQVDTHRLQILVDEPRRLQAAHVGGLAAIRVPGHPWLIGMVERVIKRALPITSGGDDDQDYGDDIDSSVQIVLIGTVQTLGGGRYRFSRSVMSTPAIDTPCYLLQGRHLEELMSVISSVAQGPNALEIGHYALDEQAVAYLDGNRFFQRHAAILGSTGSGKSFTVARILERASNLPGANLVLFDLHGEYTNLPYPRQLRIAGPDDLDGSDPNALFLPYWLLSSEELQALFIDRS